MSSTPLTINNIHQSSPPSGDDIVVLDSKLLSSLNENPIINNIANSSLNNQTLLKTISNLSSELLIHLKKQETLSVQIKTNKSIYNQQLKQYKSLIESISQQEKQIDNINLKLSSIKKKQELLLTKITEDNFQYFISIIPHIKPEIYEGFLLFVNYNDYRSVQIPFILKTKTNLTNLLENAFQQLEQKYLLSKDDYIKIKDEIENILNDNNNNIDFIFELIFVYIKKSFEFIDLIGESKTLQIKIDQLNNEKNKRFIELKALENDIIKKDLHLQSIVKYINNLNTLIEKTKSEGDNNKEILNHKLLNGYNTNMKHNDKEQSKTNDDISKNNSSNSPKNITNLKRNINNVNKTGHHKQSSLTYSSVGSIFKMNAYNCNNNKNFAATTKIKPISTLSMNTFKLNGNNNNKQDDNTNKKKKMNTNKKFSQYLITPSVITCPSNHKSVKTHTVLSSQQNFMNQYGCISEHNEQNILKVSHNNKQKLNKGKRGSSVANSTMRNIKTHIIETIELIKIPSNQSAAITQPICINNSNHVSKENLLKNKIAKKNSNQFNQIKTKSPLKLNTSKNTKTRNNNSLYTKQFYSSKQQQPNKMKQLINLSTSVNNKKLNTNTTNTNNQKQEQNIKTPNNNTSEHKTLTDGNNLTDQSENYHINTNSKDSFNISNINSVCDELTVSPLSLFPSTISNNLVICNNTNSICQGSNNNVGTYIQNNYIIMHRHKNKNVNDNVKNGGVTYQKNNYMTFKIEKPIPAGGCCVSCT